MLHKSKQIPNGLDTKNNLEISIYSKPIDLEKAKITLKKHFLDNITTIGSCYINSTQTTKKIGNVNGYTIRRKGDQHRFMVKTIKTIIKQDNEYQYNTLSSEILSEFIMAPFYSYWLKDRAPLINAYYTQDQESIGITSKYLHDFLTFDEYISKKLPHNAIEGAEKLFSAIIFGTEIDYHFKNFGVINGKYFAKIDHGKSGCLAFSSSDKVWGFFIKSYYNYYRLDHYIKLNITKMIKALTEMLKISDDEIDNLIGNRIQKLKQIHINPKKFLLLDYGDGDYCNIDIKGNKCTGVTINKDNDQKAWSDIHQFFSTNLKNQKKYCLEILVRLETIEQININNTDNKSWKEGQWLDMIKDQDPIIWALKKGLRIANNDPHKYAREKKITIANKPTDEWIFNNQPLIKKYYQKRNTQQFNKPHIKSKCTITLFKVTNTGMQFTK